MVLPSEPINLVVTINGAVFPFHWRISTMTNSKTYAHVLHSIAFEEYESRDIDFAEYLFRSACDLVDDNSLNNNLAYVLRRKRNDAINSCEIITLLLLGVQERARTASLTWACSLH